MKNIFAAGWSLMRYAPHILVYLCSANKTLLDYEMDNWNKAYNLPYRKGIIGLAFLLACYREYRTLFYFRTGVKWMNVFARGQTNLEFYTPSDKIGRGLVIWHGFSTVINVKEMGENCQVWQNVTIGKKTTSGSDDRPVIGSGAKICAGAIVVGDIKLAPNTTVGAGAIVVKDVPVAGTVVVSATSRYIITL